MSSFSDYPTDKVPQNKRLSFLSVALVHAGMVTALDQFMIGAVLGHSMTIADAWLAIAIASVIFAIITIAMGYAGMKTGLNSGLLARQYGFGRAGSVIISLVIAVSLIGWFGVQTSVFAKGLDYALGHYLGFKLSAALSGTLLTILVAFGFRALRLAARIAVPLFIIVVVTVSTIILTGQDTAALFHSAPKGEVISISSAITLITGGYIVATLITPDITRFSKNGRHVFWQVMVTIIAGEFIVNGLAITLARALGSSDVVTIMSQAAGGIGLLVVISSTLRVNDINIYCSSLNIANAIEVFTGKKARYVPIALCVGFVGTALSVAGILDRFIDFLELLGVVFPPAIGVILVNYFIINKCQEDESKITGHTESTWLIAAVCCVISSLIGYYIQWGVPALNALISAGVFYFIGCKLYRTIMPQSPQLKEQATE
ncbi:cytosine permease [Dongshaea marina]|uniref:cytosine permease n=1 Tax=Dongshaea marina TaxID=2047966 RepID=UPI000D3E7FFD|nr:cytosine permease [Dongshaea marina]